MHSADAALFQDPQQDGDHMGPYVPATDTLFVANGADGTVRAFKGGDFASAGVQALDGDADNVRVDPQSAYVYVGCGAGGLAVINPSTGIKVKDIELPAHPESFQFSSRARQIFVNLPNAGSIVVLGQDDDGPRATWLTESEQGNFAMALNEANGRVVVVYRRPPKLSIRDMRDGAVVADRDTCGDVDDVFVDAKGRDSSTSSKRAPAMHGWRGSQRGAARAHLCSCPPATA
jgi:hypothetical protein